MTTLTPLKEQSEKARKFLDYKDELENIEIALIASDIETLNDEYVKVKDRVKYLSEVVEKLSLTNTTDSSKVEELKLTSLKLDQLIEDKSNKVYELTQEIAELQSKKQ